MRKLIYILTAFILLTVTASAQETPPVGLKSVNGQFYINVPDSSIWQNKGAPYGWHRVGKFKDLSSYVLKSDSNTTDRSYITKYFFTHNLPPTLLFQDGLIKTGNTVTIGGILGNPVYISGDTTNYFSVITAGTLPSQVNNFSVGAGNQTQAVSTNPNETRPCCGGGNYSPSFQSFTSPTKAGFGSFAELTPYLNKSIVIGDNRDKGFSQYSMVVYDSQDHKGLEGNEDFSTNYTTNSYVQKGYVTGLIPATPSGGFAGLDTVLNKNKNLFDLTDKAVSRTNLGVYSTTQTDAGFVKNQNATVQTAGYFINGIGTFGDGVSPTRSTNYKVGIIKAVNPADGLNDHGFVTNINFTKTTSGLALADFDGFDSVGDNAAAINYDHHVVYQARTKVDIGNTNTLTNLYGGFTTPSIVTGIVTNAYGSYIKGPALTAGASLVNNTGLFIQGLTNGSGKVRAILTGNNISTLGDVESSNTLATGSMFRFVAGSSYVSEGGFLMDGVANTVSNIHMKVRTISAVTNPGDDGTTEVFGVRGGATNYALFSSDIRSINIGIPYFNGSGSNATYISGTSSQVVFSDGSKAALSGDITNAAGVTTIGANKVTYAKMQAVTTNKLLGSGSGTAVAEITLGPTLSFTGTTLNTNPASLIVGTPTVTAGAGAGTSPTVSVTSNGRGLQLTVTTGTLPTGTNATVATITLANALSYTPYPVFSSASGLTSLLNGASMIYMTSTGTANVTITSGTTALTAATTYVWNITL